MKITWSWFSDGELDQASLTTPGKEGWESHIGWNLNGLGGWKFWLLSRHNFTGQWSEWVFSKWKTAASGLSTFHSALTKTLPIRYWINRDNGLWLDQVYQGPKNPISIILQVSKHFWKSRALPILTSFSLNLSFPIRTSLKSHVITHDNEWRPAVDLRLF